MVQDTLRRSQGTLRRTFGRMQAMIAAMVMLPCCCSRSEHMAVLQAIREHPQHVGVQLECCGAVANLALNASKVSELVSSGGIDLVLQTMQEHRRTTKVLRSACGALFNLAKSTQSRAKVKALGVASLLRSVVSDGEQYMWCNKVLQMIAL
mmetsp:Transcript_134155/g.373892  ORF Transcript_134155/g.373892 Transcript_134155/m.373892 type:complete len:151 (-) Transcript_134155:177-629(-)